MGETVFNVSRAEEIQEQFKQEKLQVPVESLRNVATSAPGDGQGLLFNVLTGKYEPKDVATPTGGTAQTKVEVVSTEAIAAFAMVTADGKNADSANTLHVGKVVGVALAAVAPATVTNVVVDGDVENPLWAWTDGAPIFLNGTSLSMTPPTTGFLIQVGVAKNATRIIFNLKASVLL